MKTHSLTTGEEVSNLSGGLLQSQPERIQRQRSQEVAAHPSFHFGQPVRRSSDPVKVSSLSQLHKLAVNVRIMNQLMRSRADKHQVAQQRVKGAEKIFGLLPPLGPGAICFGNLEKSRVLPSDQGRIEDCQGIGAGGHIGIEIENPGPAQSTLA